MLWADGGGKTRAAVLRPIRGRDAVARTSLGARRFWPEQVTVELEEVNAKPALIMRTAGQAWLVLSIDVQDGQIQTIWIVANPEKLAYI